MGLQKIYIGDTLPSIKLQIIDPDDETTLDLTSDFVLDTAVFHVRFRDEGTDHFTRNMTETDKANGVLTHTWTATDFSSPSDKTGIIDMWAVLTDTGGEVITIPVESWRVEKRN